MSPNGRFDRDAIDFTGVGPCAATEAAARVSLLPIYDRLGRTLIRVNADPAPTAYLLYLSNHNYDDTLMTVRHSRPIRATAAPVDDELRSSGAIEKHTKSALYIYIITRSLREAMANPFPTGAAVALTGREGRPQPHN